MKKIRMKVIAALVAGLTFSGTVQMAYASPVSGETLTNIETQQDQYYAIQERINALHKDMDVILDDITYITSLIDEANARIAEIEANKAQVEAEIATTQATLLEKETEYGERLRAMYKQGNGGILSALLGAESIADFVARTDAVIKIAKIDRQMLQEIEDLKNELQAKNDALQKNIDEENALNEENKAHLAQVEVKKSESDAKMAELKAEEDKIMSDLSMMEVYLVGSNEAIINASGSSDAQLQAAINDLREIRTHIITESADQKVVNLIEKAKSILAARKAQRDREAALAAQKTSSSSVNTGGSVVSSSATGAEIVAYAKNFLGIPYVWGGNTTAGLDCSGFTRIVFSHFGVNLPRVSRDQAKIGKYVPISQAQPGDLLYFGESRVTHVAIYVGNGMMIHAPKPGDVVRISSITWHVNNYSIVGARRIIGN